MKLIFALTGSIKGELGEEKSGKGRAEEAKKEREESVRGSASSGPC